MFAVLRGVLVAAAITVIGVAVFALILNWWNASDRAITCLLYTSPSPRDCS